MEMKTAVSKLEDNPTVFYKNVFNTFLKGIFSPNKKNKIIDKNTISKPIGFKHESYVKVKDGTYNFHSNSNNENVNLDLLKKVITDLNLKPNKKSIDLVNDVIQKNGGFVKFQKDYLNSQEKVVESNQAFNSIIPKKIMVLNNDGYIKFQKESYERKTNTIANNNSDLNNIEFKKFVPKRKAPLAPGLQTPLTSSKPPQTLVRSQSISCEVSDDNSKLMNEPIENLINDLVENKKVSTQDLNSKTNSDSSDNLVMEQNLPISCIPVPPPLLLPLPEPILSSSEMTQSESRGDFLKEIQSKPQLKSAKVQRSKSISDLDYESTPSTLVETKKNMMDQIRDALDAMRPFIGIIIIIIK